MRRAFLTIFALAFPLTATSKEKIDPSQYTLEAVVEEPSTPKITTKAGEHNTTGDPRCSLKTVKFKTVSKEAARNLFPANK